MEVFAAYLENIEHPAQKARVIEILSWVKETFPELSERFAWNQPMFTDHGTFIIGFSMAKGHLAVSPEQAGIAHFLEELQAAGYTPTSMIFRIRWDQAVDYDLLKRIIAFNIADKAQCETFWRRGK